MWTNHMSNPLPALNNITQNVSQEECEHINRSNPLPALNNITQNVSQEECERITWVTPSLL